MMYHMASSECVLPLELREVECQIRPRLVPSDLAPLPVNTTVGRVKYCFWNCTVRLPIA